MATVPGRQPPSGKMSPKRTPPRMRRSTRGPEGFLTPSDGATYTPESSRRIPDELLAKIVLAGTTVFFIVFFQHVSGSVERRRGLDPLRALPGRQRAPDHDHADRPLGAGLDRRLPHALHLVRADRRRRRRVPGRRVRRRARRPDHPVARHAQRRGHDGGAAHAGRHRHRHGAGDQAGRDAAAPLAAGVPDPPVTRATIATLAALFLAGTAAVAVARFFGGSGSRGSLLASVTPHWLGAHPLWTLARRLPLPHRGLSGYDGTLFGLLGPAIGLLQYPARPPARPGAA